jgi:hypothetical protein
MVGIVKSSTRSNWITISFTEYEPFFHDEFIDYFVKEGFTQLEEEEESSLIEMKDNDLAIQFHTERDMLRVVGNTTEILIRGLESVLKFIKQVKMTSTSGVKWFELHHEALLLPDFDPLDTHRSSKADWLKKALNVDPRPFGIDYYSAVGSSGGTSLNALSQWFFVSMYPHIENPHFLNFILIIREPDYERVLKACQLSPQLIQGMLNQLVEEE